MSFVSKAVKSIGQGLGLISAPQPSFYQNLATAAAVQTAMAPPTAASASSNLDAAAMEQQRARSNGRTSTILSGGSGFDEDKKMTSKVLLGQ